MSGRAAWPGRARGRSRSAVLAIGLAAVLAGCGIRPTEVVRGGQSAGGTPPGVPLYFLADGRVSPVVRVTGAQSVDADEALDLLDDGTKQAERAAGFRTEIPDTATLSVESAERGRITVAVGLDPGRLSGAAVDQIACTTKAALAMQGAGVDRIVLAGPGGERRDWRGCPAPVPDVRPDPGSPPAPGDDTRVKPGADRRPAVKGVRRPCPAC